MSITMFQYDLIYGTSMVPIEFIYQFTNNILYMYHYGNTRVIVYY